MNASQPRPCLRSFARSPNPERPRNCCFKQHSGVGDGDVRRETRDGIARSLVCESRPLAVSLFRVDYARRSRQSGAQRTRRSDLRFPLFANSRRAARRGAARLFERRSYEAGALRNERQMNMHTSSFRVISERSCDAISPLRSARLTNGDSTAIVLTPPAGDNPRNFSERKTDLT